MIRWPLQLRDVVTSEQMFRSTSLMLYVALLLHVILSWTIDSLLHPDISAAVPLVLGILLLMALMRHVRAASAASRQHRIVLELCTIVAVVSMLTMPGATPIPASPWLIGIAGVFPLALAPVLAAMAVAGVALVGFLLNSSVGVQSGHWLPTVFATIFVGLLAMALSHALTLSLAASRQARTNDRRFTAIARATRHVFLIADQRFRIRYVNQALQEILGFTAEDLQQDTLRPTVHPEDIGQHQSKLRFLRDKAGAKIFSRHRVRHKDGHWVWLEARGYNMLHDPAINGLVFSIEDITARKDAERKLEQEHALLRAVLDLNPSMIYAKDLDGRFTVSNASFQQRFGYSSEDDLRGKTAYDLFADQAAPEHAPEMHALADASHSQDMQVAQSGIPLIDLELKGYLEHDEQRWYRTNKYPLRSAEGITTGVLGITRDITDRKEYEIKLRYQAMHDVLTGLPNRRCLLQKIADEMAMAPASRGHRSLLFCDLDLFKNVNDSHGHEFGDKLLQEISRRIISALTTDDFVARFGGDEFVILTRASPDGARATAEVILQSLTTPLAMAEAPIKIQASIGIAALVPEHHSASDWIRDADAAMYQAKERGRNRIEVFDATLQDSRTRRAQLDVALRFALERKELDLVYQPKVSMLDGSIKGFELLLRWNSLQYGAVAPDEFIPIAEASGAVVPIGLWALEQACHQLKRWQVAGTQVEGLTLAVNVSMRQLLQTDFQSEVAAILQRTGVPAHQIELELTETSAMANPQQTIATLSQLKQLGLRLALDDFGTGYSSLAYLQRLPIDILKIDKAFIAGIDSNPGDAEIVHLILALARTLHLETVAEGVETPEQVAALRRLGCTLGQGYMFSPALSGCAAEALLREVPMYSVA